MFNMAGEDGREKLCENFTLSIKVACDRMHLFGLEKGTKIYEDKQSTWRLTEIWVIKVSLSTPITSTALSSRNSKFQNLYFLP